MRLQHSDTAYDSIQRCTHFMTHIGQEQCLGFCCILCLSHCLLKLPLVFFNLSIIPVSYTHLDVYKRQVKVQHWVQ